MSEQLVRDSIRFTRGSVIHIAGKTFTAEELRDGLDRLINPPCPCPCEPPEPEPKPEPIPEPVAEPKAESEKPKATKTKTTKAKKKTTERKPAGGTVEHL